jgi:hypothetical protein
VVDIPFPKSSQPGQRPGDGLGRLINCFCEPDGASISWTAMPGLVQFADTLLTKPRGAIVVGNLLYAAYKDHVVTITPNGVVTLLAGLLSGELPVTWAVNNKRPTPDLLVVSENGCFVVTSSTVTAFADPDLPQPNSVSFLDGYFLWTIGDGRIFASDLNDITVNALSFATAESNPDGLVRGTAAGEQFFAFGSDSIEVWTNAGTSPFPLARQAVINIGIIGPWAIAGADNGWDKPQIFVASDGTVRIFNGYQTTVISTKDVERAIGGITDKTTLIASVYTFAGHAIWSLTSPAWTWEFNASTGFWHERASNNMVNWRCSHSCKFQGKWIIGDASTTKALVISDSADDEFGNPLIMTIESGPVKIFPLRIQTPAAYFDFTSGQGDILGNPDSTNPSVSVSWSHDGGATWATPNVHSLLGQQGDSRRLVRQNRAGLSTHHGVRWRLSTSSPVYRRFRGGNMDAVQRRSA